jgi:hypothetical protein
VQRPPREPSGIGSSASVDSCREDRVAVRPDRSREFDMLALSLPRPCVLPRQSQGHTAHLVKLASSATTTSDADANEAELMVAVVAKDVKPLVELRF